MSFISRLLEATKAGWALFLAIFLVAVVAFNFFTRESVFGDESSASETTGVEETTAPDPEPSEEDLPEQEATTENEPKESVEADGDSGGVTFEGAPAEQEANNDSVSGDTYSSGFPKTIDRQDVTATIQNLEVAKEVSADDYDRDLFPHWSTSEKNSACNTRWMTLYEQSPNKEWQDESECIIAEPVYWVDPYGAEDPDTGEVTHLESPDPSDFDIDHVVALEAIWSSGGATMNEEDRESIANDPINLVVTDASVNRSKGAQRADTYLPPDEEYRCEYIQRYSLVKDKYELTVTQAEKDRLTEEWTKCI